MKTGEKTKKNLLDSSCELFAKQGFYKTTMRDITDEANTNIAAVNYHFGDKDTLYVESFKHAARIETEQMSKLANNTEKPKALLEKALYWRLQGIASETPNSWLIRMFHHELSNPTVMHERIVKEIMFKQRDKLKNIIINFFGTDLTEGQFDIVFGCFLAPMLHQMKIKKRLNMHKNIFPMMKHNLKDGQRIDLIVCFIISGLEGLKKEFKNENS